MMTEVTNNKYRYNNHVVRKEEWYEPWFWPYVEKTITGFKTFPFKNDDIIVCAYPRSGTHMTWLLVRYLLQGSTEPIKDTMEDSHLPVYETNIKQEGRRAFSTHYLPSNFGDDFFRNGKHKFIHVSRNPKDALVSFFNLTKKVKKRMVIIPDSWEEFLQFMVTSDIPQMNWMTYVRGWEEFLDKNPGAPVLDLKFEEIVRDPTTAIQKMAAFLEVSLSDQFLQDMLIASKFENMKDAPVAEMVKQLAISDTENVSFYGKGKIGGWVNTFTVAQNELFDAAYKEQMEGSTVTSIYH